MPKCPVCKTPLSQKSYENALGLWKERRKHLKHLEADLQKRYDRKSVKLKQMEVKLKARLRDARTKNKEDKKVAKKDGIQLGMKHNSTLIKRQANQLDKAKRTIDILKKGRREQDLGTDLEHDVVNKLEHAFKQDDIQHTRKGGDILHIVYYANKEAGRIIYECKTSPRISRQALRQTYRAKQVRDASYSVLVTTGKKKGYEGLAYMNSVYVVSRYGVIALASLLRTILVEVAKAGISKDKRASVLQRLHKLVTGGPFKNSLDDIRHISGELEEMLEDEKKKHSKVWELRLTRYERVRWNGKCIQDNVQAVLQGKQLKLVPPTKVISLRRRAS